MSTSLRFVSLLVGGIAALSVVLLFASGVAALLGNRTTSQNLFLAVFGTWVAVVIALGFVFTLHRVVTPDS
jgi:hypothetical protein